MCCLHLHVYVPTKAFTICAVVHQEALLCCVELMHNSVHSSLHTTGGTPPSLPHMPLHTQTQAVWRRPQPTNQPTREAHFEEQAHQPRAAGKRFFVLDEASDHAAVASAGGHHIHGHHTTKGGKVVPAQGRGDRHTAYTLRDRESHGERDPTYPDVLLCEALQV